jgi:predicted nucleic acid-binding protein
VDTDVVSYLLNRHSLADVYEELLVGYSPMISFMTVAEMYRGALKRNWGPRRIAELDRHLRQFAIVPYNFRVCLSYAQYYQRGGKARETHRNGGRFDRCVGSGAWYPLRQAGPYRQMTETGHHGSDGRTTP